MGTKEEFEQVLKLVENSKLQPTIDSVFPLKEAHKALKKLEKSQHIGKIVLKI